MGFLYRAFQGGEESLLEDIVRNLGYVLSAKRGASDYLPYFGLSEPIHGSPEAAVEAFSKEVRSTIQRYEPRVTVLEIETMSEGRPKLVVQLELKSTGEAMTLAIDRDGTTRLSDEEEVH